MAAQRTNDSATTVPGRSASSTTTGSTLQEHYYTKHAPSTPARCVKRRALSPSPPSSSSSSLSSSSLLSLPSSPSPFSPASPASTASTLPSPLPETSRRLFPGAQFGSERSESAPAKIPSAEWKPDPTAAQTTRNPSSALRREPGSSKNPRSSRPTSKQRNASAQEIDGNIEKLIEKPTKFNNKELGYVYVMPFTHGNNNIIKIGFTTKSTVEERRKEITDKCKCLGVSTQLSESSLEHRRVKLFYKRVEKLAHEELANFRYNFSCCCRKKHKEYFAVGDKIGHMVVERWARFYELQPLELQPEKGDFKLTAEWKFYLDHFCERNHGRGEECEKKDDHLKRHKRWETFVASKRWYWYRYRLGLWWKKPCGWQLWSLLLSVWLMIFKLSWWTSIPLLATAGGICREESAREPIVELANLLVEVVVYYFGRWLPISEKPAPTTCENKQIEEMARGKGNWEEEDSGDDERQEKEEEWGGLLSILL